MEGILLVHRGEAQFALEGDFSLVKQSAFETQSDVLKAMISQS
jgi:hypothetical protein